MVIELRKKTNLKPLKMRVDFIPLRCSGLQEVCESLGDVYEYSAL